MATETDSIPHKNCCRTCMKEDSLMFDLFIERIESSNIADMLKSCTKLTINKDDSLPKQICRYCYNCIISFSHFCNMARKAEEKLKGAILDSDVFNHNDSEGDIFGVKIEHDDNDIVFDSQTEVKYEKCCQILDENKNSEPYNSQVSKATDCKIEDIEILENANLNCVYCNKMFSKLSKPKFPQQTHLNIDKIRCKFCATLQQNENVLPLTVNDEKLAICVVNEQNAESDLICIICSSRFKSVNSLSAHMKTHIDKDRVISCSECGKVFNKVSHLKRHKTVHKDSSPQISLNIKSTSKENTNINICEPKISNLDLRFQCDTCLSMFKNINSLSAHMRKHTEKGRIISCRECNKVFKKISHLKRHEVQHEINCPFKCSVCPKSFPNEEVLIDHINKHKGVKPHDCPVCGKKFSHLSTLTTHIKIHTRDKACLCPTCGKKFDSSTNLNQHILRHMGLKEFACTLCPKRFISKGELKSHTITHTGERSYTCDQCGATFTKRSSLTKHKKRHLGLKPHQCDICPMRFTCKDHLKRHYRIHTGEKPYKCDMCDRAFTQSNDLVKHRRSHVGDKVYKCPQCSEGFRLHIELRQHISEHFVSSQIEAVNVSNTQPKDGVSS